MGLHMGSSLIYLPILAPGSMGVVFTASGLKFTSLSSANKVVINDQTLVAGGLFYNNIKSFFNYYN